MTSLFAALYGLSAYVLFVVSLLYAIGFVGNIAVPKSIDSGFVGPPGQSLIIDLVLLALFAVQHSVMAREGFKRWWTRIVPSVIERSTYVMLASLILLVLFWQWRPLTARVWSVENTFGIAILHTIFWSGWVLLLLSSFMISHFELFGLKQVFSRLFGWITQDTDFHAPYLYKHVRHPIYLSFLLAFWAAPVMTVGHLVFAIGTTGYILIGIQLEERDLIGRFGDQYRRYREQVGMLLPKLARRTTAQAQPSSTAALKRDVA